MNWKEKLKEDWPKLIQWLRDTKQFNDPYEVKKSQEVIQDFISKQIIEKLLEDIPDGCCDCEWLKSNQEADGHTRYCKMKTVKQQLKDKWL